MSRSYKHIACYTDHNASTWRRKRWASKAIRKKTFELTNGNMYKKMYETWSICDYRFRVEWCIPNYFSSEDITKARRK
jgi:hypothetical protein